MLLKVVCLLTALAVTVADRVTPAPVVVWKCCRIGEGLQQAEADGGFRCVPGASPLWAPLVYAPRRRAYLPLGTVPPHWTVLEAQSPACAPPARPALVRSSKTHPVFFLFANGSLWLQETETMLPPASFCVDTSAAVVCAEGEDSVTRDGPDGDSPQAQVKRTVKVKKCCGEEAVYSEKSGSCVSTSEVPELLPEDIALDSGQDENGTFGVQLVSGFPACQQDGGLVIAGLLSDSSLLPDGSLKLSGAGLLLSKEHYCVDRVLESREAASVFACSASVPTVVASDAGDIRFTLYPVGLLISTAFLLATLAAGFLLPSSHHALHWRCQTHYIACLLVGDLILAITQLASNSISGTACVTMAILMHFFFLAAFFWLNTMCFNIWWTFRDFRPTSLEKRQEVCRLRVYEVFAWGGPLLIAGVAAALDRLPPDPLRPFLRPRFGVRNCWFYGDMEILTFFFGPIGVLLGVNLLLFASTARQLTCGLWKREDVKSTTERAALGRVCMKLVVVMGVTWVADVISWAVGGPDYVWYITDLINALQGVLIFIVVGCQPQVWAAVKKMWCLKKLRSNVTNTTGAPMHSSSQGLPSMGDSVTNNTIANTNNSNVKIPMETVC